METVTIRLADDELFERLVHGGLPEAGDVKIVTKDDATEGRRPAVCISFTVQLPNGKLATAQCVITGRNFALAAAAFRGRYGDEGDAVRTPDKVN